MDTMSEGTINRFYKKQFKTSKEKKKKEKRKKKDLETLNPISDKNLIAQLSTHTLTP